LCLRALRGAVSVSLPPLFTIFMCIKLSNECTRCLGAAALAGSGAGRRRARLRRAGPRTANRAFRGACGSAVGGLSRPEVGLDAAPSGRARRPAPPDGGGYPPRPLPRSGAAAEPPIRNSQHMVRWTAERLWSTVNGPTIGPLALRLTPSHRVLLPTLRVLPCSMAQRGVLSDCCGLPSRCTTRCTISACHT